MMKFITVAASVVFTLTTALTSFLSSFTFANANQRQFVKDLYTDCNGNKPNIVETYMIYNGTTDGKQLAYNMLHSEKFYKQNLTEDEIINLYYNIFLETDATEWDLQFWRQRITVEDTTLLLYGMINSNTFEEKCARYNINSEDYFIENVFTEGIYNNNEECGLDANGDYVFYATFGDATYYHVVKEANKI